MSAAYSFQFNHLNDMNEWSAAYSFQFNFRYLIHLAMSSISALHLTA